MHLDECIKTNPDNVTHLWTVIIVDSAEPIYHAHDIVDMLDRQ